MPKKTFLNLSAAKRQRFVKAARAEFAARNYAAANLDEICRKAGIPKGSLYQYFENKRDLYDFISHQALDEAWHLLGAFLEKDPPRDCFDMLGKTWMFLEKMKREEPQLLNIYYRAGYEHKQVNRPIGEHNDAFLDRFLSWGIGEGMIDPKLDRVAVAFMIDAVSNRFQEEVLFPRRKKMREKTPPNDLAMKLLELLRRALGPLK
jgi:AcrR family transcriptional regulator